MPTKRFAAAALTAMLVFAGAGCGDDKESEEAAENIIVPDAQVTSGLAVTQKLMSDIQSGAVSNVDKELDELHEGWEKYEGTVKKNETALYLDFEDAIAAFQKAMKDKKTADATAAATKFSDTARAYLAKHPG
jgi:iron uptake system EfeUOB component EfeO/EfeM